MAPASATQEINPNPGTGLGLSFLLGNEYDRKKEKLQQELQLDYKHHLSKKKDLKTGDALSQPQGLSLPIYERTSVKEKLREERRKEYNLFLQEQAQMRRLKRETAPDTSQAGQIQGSDVTFAAQTYPPPTSRREAATMTETLDNAESTETGRQYYRHRRRWELYRPRDPYNSEDELTADEDEEEAFRFRLRRRKDGNTSKPKYKERRNRVSPEIKEVEAPVVEQNNSNSTWKSDLQQPDSMKTAATTTPGINKDKPEFATGLIIGVTEERMDAQMRKEQYKQELLKQIAEQQENKMKEKRLELRVAATGATDPEKEPDRITQFGAINHQYDSLGRELSYKRGADLDAVGKDPNLRSKDKNDNAEQRAPFRKSQLPKNTESRRGVAQGVSTLIDFSEDYHRDFSNMLGEAAIPRVAGAAPPVPPIVPNTYNTPYDAAYFYYGAKNPLDSNPPYNQSTVSPLSFRNDGVYMGVQQSGIPSEKSPCLKSSGHLEAPHQHRTPPLEEFLEDKSKQRRERLLSYQEALKQQMKEREERKRIDKEEKEQYDAKIEAEMTAYSPWGRSGGGAPIKDQKGNLISDLNQMHKANKDSYRNPVSSPTAEVKTAHPLSGLSDQPPPQQLHMQDSYKEALKLQMEEKKRMQAEEKERMKIEEEKEEKRLAEQRARIRHEYEEEQRKHKKIEHRVENQNWIPEPKLHCKTEEKTVRQEKQTEAPPQSTPPRQEKHSDFNYVREPSPPIPTLQRRQTNLVASQPSSAVSQLSSRSERSASAPQHQPPPDPAQLHQPHNGQQEVIRELSALRRYLRKEHKRLEGQLGQTATPEINYTLPHRRRPRVDAFQSVHKESSAESPSSAAAHANKENIREFNQLKYRDTTSREEVRAMFPDPPADAQSLDIQQQALLREQQRKLRLLNRQKERDFLDHQSGSYYARRKPEGFIHRDSMLPSENVFIDFSSGDTWAEQIHQQRSTKPAAKHWERMDSGRRHDYDVPDSADLWEHTNHSAPSRRVRPHNQQHIISQDGGDHNSRAGALCGDEMDVSSLCSALGRRVSVETVATEPWLRPGTSNAVKHSSCRESGLDAPPWLTHRVL